LCGNASNNLCFGGTAYADVSGVHCGNASNNVCFGGTAYADVCGVHCVETQAIIYVSEEPLMQMSLVYTMWKRKQ